MSLSDAKVRNAKPQAKPYKISDGEGLYLLVTPTGSKYWRFKYLFAGKEKLLAFGVYPDVSLGDARDKRKEARVLVAAKKDPGAINQEAKRLQKLNSQNTLEGIALEWHEKRKHEWVPSHTEAVLSRLKRHVFPKLGHRPITEITAPEILACFRSVEKAGTLDTMQRALQYTGKIFMYAIATGRAERNPVPDLRGAFKVPVRENHNYLKPDELPEYLEKLEKYDGHEQTKSALKLLLLTFVRTTELRAAEWTEFDLDKAEWRIPAERMKMKEQHIVPLSRQAIAVLKELEKKRGNRQYVFPNLHDPDSYMSANTMIYALYRMGYHSRATGHGFRSTASTVLNENGFAADVIERQLAHGERNKVRAAYNHAQYLPERRKMMQWWADFLSKLKMKP